jgi:hypothetical protein
MTLGWSRGIAALADAVEDALLPTSVAVVEVAVPDWPLTVTVTVVPTGMFVAARATATGLVVPVGRVMSGDPKDPVGVGGAATPPTEVIIASVGALGRVTMVGAAYETAVGGAPLNVRDDVFVKPSIRMRPRLPGTGPPPFTLTDPPPATVVAINRTAPPDPPPPGEGELLQPL